MIISGIEGIDEEGLARLVTRFYGKVRQDPLIGPVFNDAIDDWPRHLDKLAAFWSSLMLATGRYDGRPMRPHLILPLEGKHFDRWLDLFEITAHEVCPPDIAQAFIVRARRIADSFEMARASQRGEFAAPRHSLR